MQLYTFAVFTAEVMRAIEAGQYDDETAPSEQIKINAASLATARHQAEQEALRLYGPGTTLSMLPPGSGVNSVAF